jgi:hypothetical protein
MVAQLQDEPRLLVDAQHVATALGVPLSWVRAKTRQGEMPGAVSLGRYWRYDFDAIRRHIESKGRV